MTTVAACFHTNDVRCDNCRPWPQATTSGGCGHTWIGDIGAPCPYCPTRSGLCWPVMLPPSPAEEPLGPKLDRVIELLEQIAKRVR